ncbi:hypothetical protein GIB67_014175 [Kingdonia uniflora]|uniref:RIN4 pathogenic type III effector avirulence factor Avr cleavage site domain-containing protein n=1 Tax=Kingdonia uniflora TaxID=39325 RepID=A0A7J7PBI4_9MAGN|nr:hypothetical protein GIB67_014175 [Kingdonia uniflora]
MRGGEDEGLTGIPSVVVKSMHFQNILTIWRDLECVDQGRPLPKFGDWDVNDPASAEGFTVIFTRQGMRRRQVSTSNLIRRESESKTISKKQVLANPRRKNGFAVCNPPTLSLDDKSIVG